MKRLTIARADDAAALLLTLAGSSRKQSDVIEKLIRQAAAHPAPSAGTDLDELRLQMLGLFRSPGKSAPGTGATIRSRERAARTWRRGTIFVSQED